MDDGIPLRSKRRRHFKIRPSHILMPIAVVVWIVAGIVWYLKLHH